MQVQSKNKKFSEVKVHVLYNLNAQTREKYKNSDFCRAELKRRIYKFTIYILSYVI